MHSHDSTFLKVMDTEKKFFLSQTSGGMIKIKLSRGPICSTPAFERHFEWCLLHYGPVLCVNLLGTRNQEQMLSQVFQELFQQLNSVRRNK